MCRAILFVCLLGAPLFQASARTYWCGDASGSVSQMATDFNHVLIDHPGTMLDYVTDPGVKLGRKPKVITIFSEESMKLRTNSRIVMMRLQSEVEGLRVYQSVRPYSDETHANMIVAGKVGLVVYDGMFGLCVAKDSRAMEVQAVAESLKPHLGEIEAEIEIENQQGSIALTRFSELSAAWQNLSRHEKQQVWTSALKVAAIGGGSVGIYAALRQMGALGSKGNPLLVAIGAAVAILAPTAANASETLQSQMSLEQVERNLSHKDNLNFILNSCLGPELRPAYEELAKSLLAE